MALQKSIMSPSGVEAQYHKIMIMSLDRRNEQLEVSVACFVSKEARDAHKSPLLVVSKKIDAQSLDHDQPLMQQIYEKLKLLPEFENAVDA
jgi:hypothetical protein